MAVSNHLLLSTKAEEDSKDDLLSALSNIAYAIPVDVIPKPEPVAEPVKKKRNKFFYKPTRSFFEDVEDHKSITRKTVSTLEYVNKESEERAAAYREELPPALSKHIESVREFFLNEIDPLVLGVQGGTAQALDVVQKTLESAVDPMPFAQFERMVAHARLYKMASFIVKYMKLPKTMVDDLMYAVQPKKEVMIIGPNADERQGPRRHERIAAAQKQREAERES